jgi:hypothetical protein
MMHSIEHVGVVIDPAESKDGNTALRNTPSDSTAAPPCDVMTNLSGTEAMPSKPPVAKFRKRTSTGNCLKEQPSADAIEPDDHSPSDSRFIKNSSLANCDSVNGATLSTSSTSNGVNKKCVAVARNKNDKGNIVLHFASRQVSNFAKLRNCKGTFNKIATIHIGHKL